MIHHTTKLYHRLTISTIELLFLTVSFYIPISDTVLISIYISLCHSLDTPSMCDGEEPERRAELPYALAGVFELLESLAKLPSARNAKPVRKASISSA